MNCVKVSRSCFVILFSLVLCLQMYADQGSSSNCDLTEKNLEKKDFRGCDFSNRNLSGLDLSGANFERAVLRNVDFSGATMRNVSFRWADLSGAILFNADFSFSDFRDVEFSHYEYHGRYGDPNVRARLSYSKFDGANFEKALINCDPHIKNVSFKNANLKKVIFFERTRDLHYDKDIYENVTFEGANLSGAILNIGHLYHVNFKNVNFFKGVIKSRLYNNSDIFDVDFSGAKMVNSKLLHEGQSGHFLMISKSLFNNTDLTSSYFKNIIIHDSLFKDTLFNGASFSDIMFEKGVALNNVNFKDSTLHLSSFSPSIDMNNVDLSTAAHYVPSITSCFYKKHKGMKVSGKDISILKKYLLQCHGIDVVQ